MELAITHAKISSFNVIVKTSGLFRRARLFVDGNEVKLEKHGYELGNGAVITVNQKLLDPVPDVCVDGIRVDIAPKIEGFAYVWVALPVLLILIGGFIGGLIGGIAMLLNFRIFRGVKEDYKKYIFTAIVTIISAFLFLAVAGVIQGTLLKNAPR